MQTSVLAYFQETVKRCPQKTAVIDNDRRLTFSELAWQGQKLGSAIEKVGGGKC